MRALPLVLWLTACSRQSAPARHGRELPLVFDGDPPRNLLMISIDTLRKDHVGRYARGDSLTPFLDELFEQGVALDDFTQCANWTFPSVTCTLGGRDGVDRGHLAEIDRDHRTPIPEGTPFLATWLADRGMATFLFSINTWLSAAWGTSQGYQHEEWPAIFHTEEIVSRAADAVQDAIAVGQADRWFLHVHVKEPHAPYHPPLKYMPGYEDLPPIPWDLDDFYVHYDVTRDLWPDLSPEERALLLHHLRVRYDGEVRWLDTQLRAAFDDLEARGLLDDTLVVVWTDHGEQFYERGHQTHAYDLGAEEVDAVALLWAHDLRPMAWEGPVASIDLAPTLLAAFGAPIPPEITGYPLGSAPPDRIRFASTQGRLGGLSRAERDGLAVIFRWEEGTVQAYDRAVDPKEQVDVWDPADPAQAALWEALAARTEAEAALAPHLELVWP